MLDFINCQEGPDPTRLHRTDLDEVKGAAVTLAPWDFKEGEQVKLPLPLPLPKR